MGAYKYIQKTMQKEYASRDENYKQRLITMRREPTVLRLDKPTNIASARSLGYKAKQGFVVARVRVVRGSGMQTRPNKGRRPKRMGINKLTRNKSKQVIAEEKAQRKFKNLEVLNSYWIAEDGQHKWFEIIMVDPSHPSIANDPKVSWTATQRGRAHRGKTSAGRKGRGMGKKGKGTEKTRPSIRSNKRTGK